MFAKQKMSRVTWSELVEFARRIHLDVPSLSSSSSSRSERKHDKSNERRRLRRHITEYLNRYSYAPRYLRGLTEREQWRKKFEIRLQHLRRRDGKNVDDVSTLDPSRVGKVKESRYTQEWHRRFPGVESLQEKSEVSGVPVDVLLQVDRKGRAAWRGSQHRPGATQAQWGIARVNSFLLCGKTWYFPDHLLVDEARKSTRHPSKLRKIWKECDDSQRGKRTKSR